MNELLKLRKRLPHLVLISMALLMISITAASAAEVYMDPASSSITCGQEAQVNIKVNACDFQGGQIEFTYDPACVNLKDLTVNTAVFSSLNAWSEPEDGRVRIGFGAPAEMSGEYVIATFTMECVSDSACSTNLDFVPAQSKIVDDQSNAFSVEWTGGTFAFIADDQDSENTAKVYMDPASSSITCGQEAQVNIKVNACDFQGGQIEFTYDPACVNLKDLTVNTAVFSSLNAWSEPEDGRVRIGFGAPAEMSGEYVIATFTMECVSDSACSTNLDFVPAQSKIVDDQSNAFSVEWTGGTFAFIADDQDSENTAKVYMDPASSSITCGQEAQVNIKVNACDFQGGQIEFTYDPACANLKDLTVNTAIFSSLNAWSEPEDGRVRIGFGAPAEMSGEYVIATFTMECVSDSACSTNLDFVPAQSKIVDDQSNELDATWQNGYFSCTEKPDGLLLSAGWNFVSVPYELADPSFASIIGDLPADCVMGYDALKHTWENSMVLTWVPLKGYWIHATEDCLISAEKLDKKLPSSPATLNLYAGWNAIGHSDSTDSLYAELVLERIDSKYLYIMGPWDPVEMNYTQCGYNKKTGTISEKHIGTDIFKHIGTDIFKMSPYEGYWLYMNETGVYAPPAS